MAIKDWKQNKQYKKDSYFNKDRRQLMIRGQTYRRGYQVDIWDARPFKSVSTRNFNTQQQALKYAKSYMRTH